MLKVKKLDPEAILPTVAHPREDLGYDLYALEDTVLPFGEVTKVHTGIAAAAYTRRGSGLFQEVKPLGLFIRDRSSMAAKGIVTSAGVIDAGYRGEIIVLMTNQNINHTYEKTFSRMDSCITGLVQWYSHTVRGYQIKAGDKIAQMVPIDILTGDVAEVLELSDASRGSDGFGSSGK